MRDFAGHVLMPRQQVIGRQQPLNRARIEVTLRHRAVEVGYQQFVGCRHLESSSLDVWSVAARQREIQPSVSE